MDGLIAWSPGVTLEDIERAVIMKAYKFYQNNKTATSNALGIAIRTLDSKLEKYESDARAQADRDAAERTKDRDFLARQRGPIQNLATTEAVQRAQVAASVHGPNAGVRLESAEKAAAQQAVPVSQPQKVQSVLPAQAPSRHSRGAR